jgi:hypothetical protein
MAKIWMSIALFLALFLGERHAFAQSISVQCSTTVTGTTSCQSLSNNAITSSAVLVGLGNIAKVKLRNIEDVPVVIQNLANTDVMTLFGEIDNRGRPQDLTISLKPIYEKSTAPSWMKRSPNAGSTIVVADSIQNLSVDISGYSGKRGRSLSKLCADKIKTGMFFPNPNHDSLVDDANSSLAGGLGGADSVCTSSTIDLIVSKAPPTFCPSNHFYLGGRDNESTPALKKSPGYIVDILQSLTDESPVRKAFLKKCVHVEAFRTCRVTASGTSTDYSDINQDCGDWLSQKKSSDPANFPQGSTVVETNRVNRDVVQYYTPTSISNSDLDNTCPNSNETFEKFSQDHGMDSYEQFDCNYANCPGAVDTYTFGVSSSVDLAIEPGEFGSYGGRADIFAYDIKTESFEFSNGTSGTNGAVDLTVPTVKKFCAQVTDARNSSDGLQSTKVPLVNFHQSVFTPIQVILPEAIPGTPFKKRTMNEAVGVYKKVDASVRSFILNEYYAPRFQ